MAISDKALQQQIEQLPKELSPERDLWAGIEKAIEHQSQTEQANKHRMPIAWAASIVVAVLLTWFGHQHYMPVPEITVASQMNQAFEQQKQLMLTSFGQPNLNQLPAEMQEQLNQLEKARKSIEKALIDDQHNSDLIELLDWTQQQELKLIEQLYSPQWQTI